MRGYKLLTNTGVYMKITSKIHGLFIKLTHQLITTGIHAKEQKIGRGIRKRR